VLIYISADIAEAIIRFGWTALVFHMFGPCKTVSDDTITSITKLCGKEEQKIYRAAIHDRVLRWKKSAEEDAQNYAISNVTVKMFSYLTCIHVKYKIEGIMF
jgi:hypothetical protein